ncbi:MAG: hypothetical protein L6R41_003808 [Letrouitia leprolyta]|nr:MAG: hypothetical protein L6R41_003808 [Letrouitia leprolyta]
MAEHLNKKTGAFNDDEECQLAKLNDALALLGQIFPAILPEVFREMLLRFEGESQLELVINQLLKNEDRWVKGRRRTENQGANTLTAIDKSTITRAELFRRNSYKWATKNNLLQEFKGLSKSTVKAVLAEKNYSYSLARPVLQDIASKSWRHSIGKFFSRWSRSSENVSEKHGMIQWMKISNGTRVPILRETGDAELDQELHSAVLAPLLVQYKAQQEARDWELAERINMEEAIKADALFECGCCFSAEPFERIATCTSSHHVICFTCIFKAVGESLFGQSWSQSINHDRGLLRCLAPMTNDVCPGCIPHEVARRAVCYFHKGKETWLKLQTRLTEEALAKSKIPLIRCPQCSYAETTDLYLPPSTIKYTLNTSHLFRTLLYILLALATIPFLPFFLLLALVSGSTPSSLLQTSLKNLSQKSHTPLRFQCRSLTCLSLTCLHCSLPWRDPHTHFSTSTNTTTTLRTAIDSARTAALKRTCPKCNTSFIKESGCNKLTCPCGYTMCYVCRQGLGPGEGGEGYNHFCQHFRYDVGKGCGECEKCDLYRGEDEDEVVRLAGQRAEREWREGRGEVFGNEGRMLMGVRVGGEGERWSLQGIVDWWVEGVVVCRYTAPARDGDVDDERL